MSGYSMDLKKTGEKDQMGDIDKTITALDDMICNLTERYQGQARTPSPDSVSALAKLTNALSKLIVRARTVKKEPKATGKEKDGRRLMNPNM